MVLGRTSSSLQVFKGRAFSGAALFGRIGGVWTARQNPLALLLTARDGSRQTPRLGAAP